MKQSLQQEYTAREASFTAVRMTATAVLLAPRGASIRAMLTAVQFGASGKRFPFLNRAVAARMGAIFLRHDCHSFMIE
jgi:hypothetical protein